MEVNRVDAHLERMQVAIPRRVDNPNSNYRSTEFRNNVISLDSAGESPPLALKGCKPTLMA